MGENLNHSPFMSHGCFSVTVTNFDAIFVCGKVSVYLYTKVIKK